MFNQNAWGAHFMESLKDYMEENPKATKDEVVSYVRRVVSCWEVLVIDAAKKMDSRIGSYLSDEQKVRRANVHDTYSDLSDLEYHLLEYVYFCPGFNCQLSNTNISKLAIEDIGYPSMCRATLDKCQRAYCAKHDLIPH